MGLNLANQFISLRKLRLSLGLAIFFVMSINQKNVMISGKSRKFILAVQ